MKIAHSGWWAVTWFELPYEKSKIFGSWMYNEQWAHTNWRTKDGHLNRLERRAHTYFLASQGWVQREGEVLSACGHSHPQESRHQQPVSVAMHDSHSPAKEPKIGAISWVKHVKASQPLTEWWANYPCCQQAWNIKDCNHTLSGEPKTRVSAELKKESHTVATHFLKSEGQMLSAGLKHSKALQPHTNWRAKRSNCQQAGITARHYKHSHSGESRQASSAGLESSEAVQTLSILYPWRAKDRHYQQAWDSTKHCSHSQPGEPKTDIINGFEMK